MLSCGRSLIDVVSHFPYISDNDGEVIDKNPTSELTWEMSVWSAETKKSVFTCSKVHNFEVKSVHIYS